ncbi:HD domain-containing protein [Clostridium sp. 'White wine YQ']|uniref:HD domain-containing protein n=1 Tax=Clostridium sp. 'White wine YQ' TaxID=3027474 RepID=UPI00236624D0|nr:HD domain-containing protein [Clostridium sp. 'White wine YQ']MDD7793399.1 HD domain-containing protein [Clostridium sp. 'White wine YQ']
MKYKDIIFKSIKYIERNIKETLTVDIIARAMGYSPYHFSRIFKTEMGISLMEYVKERRLINASKDIFSGRRILDVSIEYGYETHSGFSKSFKKKFGFSPSIIHAIYLSLEFSYKGGNYFMEKSNEIKNITLEKANIFLQSTEEFIEPDVLYDRLLKSILENKLLENLNSLNKAYDIAFKAHEGQFRKSGEPYIVHPLSVAIILSEMGADETTIIAGLLHDIIEADSSITLVDIKKSFSKRISDIICEVSTFMDFNIDEFLKNSNYKDEVILIKLADRLHNMRTIKYMEPERWNEKAKETLEIFSPLAAKLGISKIRTELDDLSLKYMS